MGAISMVLLECPSKQVLRASAQSVGHGRACNSAHGLQSGHKKIRAAAEASQPHRSSCNSGVQQDAKNSAEAPNSGSGTAPNSTGGLQHGWSVSGSSNGGPDSGSHGMRHGISNTTSLAEGLGPPTHSRALLSNVRAQALCRVCIIAQGLTTETLTLNTTLLAGALARPRTPRAAVQCARPCLGCY